VEFEWDATKAEINERKHGISFEVAAAVFSDPLRNEKLDERCVDEERWITVGVVGGEKVIVTYTLRGEVVRLISARGADRYEREGYWRGSL
jgi:uncharacterized DUF497 family protein